jgi:hypothetical protein
VLCRVVVATHPEGKKKSPVGVTRSGIVYELFFTNLREPRLHRLWRALCCICIVEHYAPQLSDEDNEQDPDRWCSHSASLQECWQVVSQWIWNLRLELGHQLKPQPLRTTEFAPAIADDSEAGAKQAPVQGYGTPAVALPWKTGRFSGQDFTLQPNGV